MKEYKCDILIVGAGPAGSSAAAEAVKSGANVLVVERRKKIGVPIRCAEYIPAQLKGEVNLGSKYIVQRIKGIRTHLPDGSKHEIKAPGYTINRDVFDQSLATHAEIKGAKILKQVMVIGKERKEVLIRLKEETIIRVKTKVIIGADGPNSTVGKWIGSINKNLIPAIQTRILLTEPIEFSEFYFNKDFFGGYGWLFPKGNYANVGVAKKMRDTSRMSLSETLKKFLDYLIAQGKIIPSWSGFSGGWVPAEKARIIAKENMLLAGDAAGHAHPVTGAGIAFAVIGGKMAGKWAACAVKENDLSVLSEYEKEWMENFKETFNTAYRKRTFMESNWNELDAIIKKCWVAFKEYYE
jgi:geranylgeranyl reductase family protein